MLIFFEMRQEIRSWLIAIFVFLILTLGIAWLLSAAEPTMPVDKDLQLLNEKKARIEAQVRIKDLEIQQLVQEYQEVITQINARNPPQAKAPDVSASPKPGPGPRPSAPKSPPAAPGVKEQAK